MEARRWAGLLHRRRAICPVPVRGELYSRCRIRELFCALVSLYWPVSAWQKFLLG
jgi:hypothetical protein